MAKSNPITWKAGDSCLAKWDCDDKWYNAVIKNKKTKFVENGNNLVAYTVTFSDYGTTDEVEVENVKAALAPLADSDSDSATDCDSVQQSRNSKA